MSRGGRPFLSGHCNPSNPARIHGQCRGGYEGLACSCSCHVPEPDPVPAVDEQAQALDLVAMLLGVKAALRTGTPRREGCDVLRVEVAWVCDPNAPEVEQLALAIQSGFLAWNETTKLHRGGV